MHGIPPLLAPPLGQGIRLEKDLRMEMPRINSDHR